MKSLGYLLLITLVTPIVTSCSSMNSKFSCNLTAGDTCMSMDEVNALTEGKTIHIIRKTQIAPAPVIQTTIRRVWIAPFTDTRGVKHEGAWMNVPESITK